MARDFSGSNQFLSGSFAAVTTHPYSIAFWFNSRSDSGRKGFININDNSTSNEIQLGTNTDTVELRRISGGGTSNLATSTTFSTNVWNHACCTSSAANAAAVFLNGGGKATDTTTRTFSGLAFTDIGQRVDGSQDVDGLMAELGIWDTALADAEVLQLSLGYSPLCVRADNLVAYYPLYGNDTERNLIASGQDLTNSSTTKGASHPRVIYFGPTWAASPPPATQTITLGGIIASGETHYTAKLQHKVYPGTIASTATVYSPSIPLIQPGTIASTATVYSPALSHKVYPGTIASTATVYTPKLQHKVYPGTIASTATVYSPSIPYIQPGTIASTATVYSPTITKVDIRPAAIASTATVPTPSLAHKVYPGTIASAAQVFGPALRHKVYPGTIASTATVYSPAVSVAQVITVPVIGTTATIYAPKLTHKVYPGTIASTVTVYIPFMAGGEPAQVISTSARPNIISRLDTDMELSYFARNVFSRDYESITIDTVCDLTL